MIGPILLEVQRNGTSLRLRVDNLTFEEETFTADTITVWTLSSCDNVERAFALFTDAIGKSIYIDTYYEDATYTVTVWINYAAEEGTFTCAVVEEARASASVTDLQQRVLRLANLYRIRDQEYTIFHRRMGQATDRFQKEIDKAISRCEQKARFFQDTRPDKMMIYTTQRDVYMRVLQLFHYIIDDVHRDNNNADTAGTD